MHPCPIQTLTRRLTVNSHERGSKTPLVWRGALLLALWVSLGVRAETPSFTLPGRPSDSKEPWGAFLGKAAHEAIGRAYQLQHPSNLVFLNTFSLGEIIERGQLGEPERLSPFVRLLRPDITDVRALVLFEIKPDTEWGRKEGRAQAERYLTALNAVVDPGKKLSPGVGFEDSLFLDFENGGALWRLSWSTPEPGVTLYHWSYRPKRPHSSWKERAAQPEEELPREELEQRGELAEQAIRGAYDGGRRPKGFMGQVYLPIECN